jgi:hypothetical protein
VKLAGDIVADFADPVPAATPTLTGMPVWVADTVYVNVEPAVTEVELGADAVSDVAVV